MSAFINHCDQLATRGKVKTKHASPKPTAQISTRWPPPPFLSTLKTVLSWSHFHLPNDADAKTIVGWFDRAVMQLDAGFNHDKVMLNSNHRIYFSHTHVIKIHIDAYMEYRVAQKTKVITPPTTLLLQEIENTRSCISQTKSLRTLVVPYWWIVPNILCVMETCSHMHYEYDLTPSALLAFTATTLPALHKRAIYPLDWKLANMCQHSHSLRLIDQDMLVTPTQLILTPSSAPFVPRSDVASLPYTYMCNTDEKGYFTIDQLDAMKSEPTNTVCANLYLCVTWSALVTLCKYTATQTYKSRIEPVTNGNAPRPRWAAHKSIKLVTGRGNPPPTRITPLMMMTHYSHPNCKHIFGTSKHKFNYWSDLVATLRELHIKHPLVHGQTQSAQLLQTWADIVDATFPPLTSNKLKMQNANTITTTINTFWKQIAQTTAP